MNRFTKPGDKARWQRKVTHERNKLIRNPEKATCWICGQPIDMNLPPTHPNAFTLDHIIPIARGGKITGQTKPAHRTCNSARGQIHKTKHTNTLFQW